MSSASRATRAPVTLYHAAGPAGKSGSKLRRAGEISLTTPGLDLATRLRVFQRALRSRIDRRDALIDIVRAVNTTLEPPKIAALIVERASTWLPTPCWAVVCADLSGQLSVLAALGHRRPDAPLQLALSEPGAAARDQAGLAQRPAALAAVPRPRRLQGCQRHAWASVRQPCPRRGGGGDPAERP